MAGEWQDVTIEQIASKIAMGPFGSDIKTDNFVPSGVPVIRGGNLTSGRFHAKDFVFLTEEKADELANANAFPGDIVFTHRGTLGQVGLVPEQPFKRYVVSQSQMKLTCDQRLADPAFIYYFFRSTAGQHALLMNTSQTGVPAISRPVTSLKSVRLLLPPLPEQRSIANVLGTLDDKIELIQRMNETLEAVARALFKSWCVDFDPVRAKAAGKKPQNMDEEIAALFPDSFEDSELGKIPRGWRIPSLGEMLDEIETGSRPRGGVGGILGGVPSLGAENVLGLGKYDFSKSKYVAREFFDSMTRGKVQNRDVLLYKDGGRPGEYEPHVSLLGDGFPFDEYCINEHVYRLRVTHPLTQSFLYFWLTSEVATEEMRRRGTGVAVPGLNSTAVKSLPVLVPAPEVCEVFEATVEPLVGHILCNASESVTLARLRDALLPKLLSREIHVNGLQ